MISEMAIGKLHSIHPMLTKPGDSNQTQLGTTQPIGKPFPFRCMIKAVWPCMFDLDKGVTLKNVLQEIAAIRTLE